MRRILLLITILALLPFVNGQAGFLGIKKASETVSFFLNEPLDTAGVPLIPDSAHVLTYADDASAATYSARSTTYPFSDISIDTIKTYTDTTYVFADVIGDIDGAGGHFELAIEVKLFCDGLPTSTRMTVQIVSDSLENFLDASMDSSSNAAILSSGLVMYFGACDGCYQILFPTGGTANKDSIYIIDPSLGNDSLVGKIEFLHGTVPTVYDSSYYDINPPDPP